MAAVLVIGGGVIGLWQAATLAAAGHDVELIERSAAPFSDAASRLGGAMISPFCEAESAEPVIAELGVRSAGLWREAYPALTENGSLVVAAPRDMAELGRFARLTSHYEQVDAAGLAGMEPALAERFSRALFYPAEAHLEPRPALEALLKLARSRGAKASFGAAWDGVIPRRFDYAVDCRGIGARDSLPGLRAVRGEMLVVETAEIALSRPVRLLHPRFPLYVVPWSGHRFMVGATMIESEDAGPATLRSALDLLGHAYALHPAFGEARIVGFEAGLRPAFADNVPKAVVRGRHILVNGAYRHGYLLAPVLAEAVAAYIAGERNKEHVLIEDHGER